MTSGNIRLAVALLLVIAVFVPRCARAVENPAAGHIEGQVKDALDRPVDGAHLGLEAADGRTIAKTTSNPQGAFAFTGIAPGVYSLKGEKEGFEPAVSIVTLQDKAGAKADLVMAAKQALNLNVTAQKLNEARNQISPRIGGSTYEITRQSIETQPQGNNTPFNQVLLQAPGVAQDSFGQLHIRGDHADLQYRLNGVLLPEGIAGFGQVLDSRIADRADLITGALPAQFGYRTAGVVDIQTKSGAFENSNSVGMYGGSQTTLQPSFESMGSSGNFNYYASGSYIQDDLGIESPTGDPHALHDFTQQGKAFAYMSDLLDPDTRVSLIAGSSTGNFQIPDNPNQTPNFTAFGVSNFDSSKLNENQYERNHYGVLAMQQSLGDLDYQVAAFTRYSTTLFTPDILGDLIFNGVASRVYREDFASGLQGDGSYKLNDAHTLRAGYFFSGERAVSQNLSTVEPVSGGVPIDSPFTIQDNNAKVGWLYGLYLQDEWRISQQVTLNYGGRFDLVDAFTHGDQVSPRVNIVYKPWDQTTLHAGYSRYFTPPPMELVAPTSIQKFANTTNAPEVTQDSTVQSERADYFDAGIIQKVTPEVQLGADGYYKLARHLLDEGQFGQALVFSPFNYANGKIYGLELTSSFHRDKLSAYANLAFSHAYGKQIESGQFQFSADELAYIADHWVHLDHDQLITASYGASYDLEGTLLSVDGLFGSGLRNGFANTTHLPEYAQVNFGASHPFMTDAFGKVTARFDVINVFDEKYELRDGSGIGVFAPQFGPRRGLFAGLVKEF